MNTTYRRYMKKLKSDPLRYAKYLARHRAKKAAQAAERAADPRKRAEWLRKRRAHQKARRAADPNFVAYQRAAIRKWYRKRRRNSAWRAARLARAKRNRELRRPIEHARRAANPEKHAEKKRKHREYIRARVKRDPAFAAYLRRKARDRYRHNPIYREATKAAARAWNRSHLEERAIRQKIWNHDQRARKAGVPSTFTYEQWTEIKRRQQHHCRYCGLKRLLTIDHVVPLPPGPNTKQNIVAACRGCNSSKGNRRKRPRARYLRKRRA